MDTGWQWYHPLIQLWAAVVFLGLGAAIVAKAVVPAMMTWHRRWRLVAALFGLLFAYYLWPTPWQRFSCEMPGYQSVRVNRFTGRAEIQREGPSVVGGPRWLTMATERWPTYDGGSKRTTHYLELLVGVAVTAFALVVAGGTAYGIVRVFATEVLPEVRSWQRTWRIAALLLTAGCVSFVWPTPFYYRTCTVLDDTPPELRHGLDRPVTVVRTSRLTGHTEILLPDGWSTDEPTWCVEEDDVDYDSE